jgi:radical SAM family RiPP maturation amino acid epimerase
MLPVEAVSKVSALGLIWLEMKQRARDHVIAVRNGGRPCDPRFAAWRERQIARCDLSFHPRFAETIPHIPFAIELSKGCSVGCWFCGVSAPKLDGHYVYSEQNAAAFRAMLQALAHVTGRAAGEKGILYFATDPLDHPDYERFCGDFTNEFGAFPRTTTALGLKRLPRTRELIRLSGRHSHPRMRFSILTTKMLDRYRSELSASELTNVCFAVVNKGSFQGTSYAGRARERPAPSMSPSQGLATSISCLSGFRINLVDRTVRLLSPCPSTEQWPDGYFVYDEGTYADADDFASLLERMIERNMPESPPPESRVSFSSDLAYRPVAGGFELSGEARTRKFTAGGELGAIADLISSGRYGVPHIMAQMAARCGVAPVATQALIDEAFRAGALSFERV